ncbi:MAG: pyridoxal phosphate-dependent aminotransferase [Eubacterium sp.]|nr:pyridoxal phosphate-dependent aminotransferase [Eubacterium sp.]
MGNTINTQHEQLGKVRSTIREIFEYGNKRRMEIGAENVFDFSLGNPSVPAPEMVKKTYMELLQTESDIELHGYTSAQGALPTRKAIAENLNSRYGTAFHADNFYMTCGAAASLRVTLGALITPGAGEEVVTFTPYFPEYKVFVESSGAKLVESISDPETFQIDFTDLSSRITPQTKAVLINSPNNPSGVVIREEGIRQLAELLQERSAIYGHTIYIMTDEPYRELVYDAETVVPFVTKYYDSTIVCYSFSKSLSMPGERIGYILVPDACDRAADIYAAVCGAGRALGYVCAPSMVQKLIARCAGEVSDVQVYKKNRDILYGALTEYGYKCVYPDGAFYLFFKALEEDAGAFCNKARDYELLLVPADSFGTPGYVRLAYCVSTEQIEKSLPAFKALADSYK